MAGSDDEIPPPPPPPPQNTGHNTPLTLLSYWEVIQRGRKWSYECSNDTNGVIKVLPLKTAEEKSPPEEGNIRSSLGLSLLPVLKISLIYENQAKMVFFAKEMLITGIKISRRRDDGYTGDVPHKALENKGIVDSGCSRHMTGQSLPFLDVLLKSKTINNVRYIIATVAEGKPNNQAIFDTIQLMGYRPFDSQPVPSPPHPSADQPEAQTDPSLRPSPFIPIPDSIPEGSGGNHGGQSSSDRSLSGNEDGLTLQSVYDLYVSLCIQVTAQAKEIKNLKAQIKKLKNKARPGRKSAKSKPTTHKDQVFDDLDDFDGMDYMETEDAYNEKGVSTEDQVSTDKPKVSTDKSKVSTDKPKVSTDKPKVSTDQLNVSTDKLDEGTAELKEGNSEESATSTTSTPTPIVFRDDETIAEFLVSMSQNKAKKGVEIKDAEDSDRARPTLTRSLLTLRPLPKIDLKDKGKKVLEEEAESDDESEGVNEAERKFAQLTNDEEIARKVQEEWEAEEEKKKLAEEEVTKAALIKDYDDIQARIKADSILAARLQEEEREKFTIKEMLHDTIAA
ncbi:hypothetical protein Tco_0436543 [Tanacetum coccineum]